MARTAASMCEQHYTRRSRRNAQVTIQMDGIYLDSYWLMCDCQARGSLAGSRLVHTPLPSTVSVPAHRASPPLRAGFELPGHSFAKIRGTTDSRLGTREASGGTRRHRLRT